jgi:small-conductance mechanosensitive channel
VAVTLHYEADVEKARSILLALAKQDPRTKTVTGCPVTKVGPAGLVLTLSVWCANAGDASDLNCALLEESRKQFIRAGLKPPFPQQFVTVEGKEEGQTVEGKSQKPEG